MITQDYIKVNGIQLAVYQAGPKPQNTNKPAIVLMHGFPDLAYSWRHLQKSLGDLGYPVIAPDMRGYGLSDKPEEDAAYSGKVIAQDMAGLLDHYRVDRAIFIGHDWGALILWCLLFEIPDRLLGTVGLNVGYVHPDGPEPIALYQKALGDDMYMVRFQTEGLDEGYLNSNVGRMISYFCRKQKADKTVKGDLGYKSAKVADHESRLELTLAMREEVDTWGGEVVLSDDELDFAVKAFEHSGFDASLRYYRNVTQNWQDRQADLKAGWQGPHPLPCLMITADMDIACPPKLADKMAGYFSDFSRHDLVNCGHWSLHEKGDEVSHVITAWLEQKFQ